MGLVFGDTFRRSGDHTHKAFGLDAFLPSHCKYLFLRLPEVLFFEAVAFSDQFLPPCDPEGHLTSRLCS